MATEETTRPEIHSQWYLPGYTAQDIMVYYGEIALGIEFQTDSDAVGTSLVRKREYQSLGLLQDTSRSDSIVYWDTLQAEKSSELDWLLLKLHYHPAIKTGMAYSQCTDLIECLYN